MPDDDVPDATEPSIVAPNGSATSPVSIRRSNPRLVAILLLLIAGTGVLIWWEARPEPPQGPPRAYYTTDDGKTWFADDAEKLPPFDHAGKQAVRLRMFTCDGGKTRVGYMEKLPEEAFTTLRAEGTDPYKMDDDDIAARFGWSAKSLGDSQWVNSKADSAGYTRITQIKCPDGRPLLSISPKAGE